MNIKKYFIFSFIFLISNIIYPNDNLDQLIIKNETEDILEIRAYLNNPLCFKENIVLRLDKEQSIKLSEPLLSNIQKISYYKYGQWKSILSEENFIDKKDWEILENPKVYITIKESGKRLWGIVSTYNHKIDIDKDEIVSIEKHINEIIESPHLIINPRTQAEYRKVRASINIPSNFNIYSLIPMINDVANKDNEVPTKEQFAYIYYISILYNKIRREKGLKGIESEFKDCLKSLSNNKTYKDNITKILIILENIVPGQVRPYLN